MSKIESLLVSFLKAKFPAIEVEVLEFLIKALGELHDKVAAQDAPK